MKVYSWILGLCFLSSFSFAQGYDIKAQLNNLEADTCLLTYYSGSQILIRDTAVAEKNTYRFSGEKAMPQGVYILISLPDKRRLTEFLVGEDQKFELSLDVQKPLDLKVKGAQEPALFAEYTQTMNKRGKALNEQAQALQGMAEGADKAAKQKELEATREALIQFQQDFAEKNADKLAGIIVRANLQPVAPENIRKNPTSNFYYVRDHYFDGVDWSDDRLVRTPIIENKLNYYLDKMIVHKADSLIPEVENILQTVLKAGNKEMFKFTAIKLLNKYANSKVIGDDAVYVHIGEKYYCSGMADWVEEEQLKKICDNVRDLKPNLMGNKAPNIDLKRMDGTPVQLYQLPAKFTVVYFWDPNCGKCSKTSEAMKPLYEKFKPKGVEIFGVCSENWENIEKCRKKVKEMNLTWINTSGDAYPLAVTKKYYDLRANPTIFLLDEEKRILWKRINVDQLDEILSRELGMEPSKKAEEEEEAKG